LSHIKFLAVGGVNADNAAEFLKAGAVGLGVGSCLVNKKWADAGEFYKITAEAKRIIENISK
jgi:2-dehydro-3-deoxyphosphogluconate aldolase/(4S)-4-hydroxy-2-oxoglutarate aldolase